MKIKVLLFILSIFNTNLFSQKKEEAEILVSEGIAMHDKGDFDGALFKYDKALELDKDNLNALAEKAMSLMSLQQYDESIRYCQLAIEKHPDGNLKNLYVNYGNALDGLKKVDEALAKYDEGTKRYPDYFQLHFNKGITLATAQKYDEALLCFQKSVALNPKHTSSHNAIARIEQSMGKRIPSIMAFLRFLLLEQQSNRAKENLVNLQTLMKAGAKETGKNSVSISITPDMLSDSDDKPTENNFASTDLLLTMTAGLDYDKKNKKKTEVELFIRKFEIVCSLLSETKKENFGFYWEYYAPYLIEMETKNLIEPFAYLIFTSSNDPSVMPWLTSHQNEIEKFNTWSESFAWKKF